MASFTTGTRDLYELGREREASRQASLTGRIKASQARMLGMALGIGKHAQESDLAAEAAALHLTQVLQPCASDIQEIMRRPAGLPARAVAAFHLALDEIEREALPKVTDVRPAAWRQPTTEDVGNLVTSVLRVVRLLDKAYEAIPRGPQNPTGALGAALDDLWEEVEREVPVGALRPTESEG